MLTLRICARFRPDTNTFRLQSTLADKMKQAISGINPKDSEEDQKRILSEQRDSKVMFNNSFFNLMNSFISKVY